MERRIPFDFEYKITRDREKEMENNEEPFYANDGFLNPLEDNNEKEQQK